jgi:hypothetical protein
MTRTRLVAATLVALSVLAGCGSNGDPAPAPTGVATVASDGTVTVTWNDDTSVSYWLFVSSDARLTTENFTTLTDVRVLRNVRSPYVLCGNPNGLPLYFTLNGRTDGGPGGPGTPTQSAVPRSAGDAWTAGTAPSADINAVAFVPLTTCLINALPTGIFVAAGPGGTLASSTDGRTFTARAAPAGFTTDLFAVAGFSANLNNTTTPGTNIVAVGAGGASVTSTDGVTWTAGAAFDAAVPTLRAMAIYGANFIAVGDGGTVRTSTDGIAWTARTSGTTADLLGIGCGADRCIAVGAGGVVLASSDIGVTWTPRSIAGAGTLRRAAYGNYNNNLGNGGLIAINTWVAVGDGGAAYYSTDGGTNWTASPVAGAGDFVGLGYTTRFVAVDAAGNSFSTFTGQTWSAAVATGATGLRALAGTGSGYVAAGAAGATSSSF